MNAGHFLRLKNKIAIAPKKCTTSDTLTCFNKICLLVFFCKAISTIKRQERVLLSDGKLNIFCQSWRNKFNCPSCGQKAPKVRKSRKEIVVELRTPQFPFEILTFNMSKARFCKVSSTLAENNKCFLSRVTLQPWNHKKKSGPIALVCAPW